MRELSIFIDESGDIGSGSKYYLLSLVFHDQSIDIDNWLTSYERSCIEGDLPRHTFHFTPILRGHPPFGSIDFSTRKALLGRFRFLLRSSRLNTRCSPMKKDTSSILKICSVTCNSIFRTLFWTASISFKDTNKSRSTTTMGRAS